jgi:hypothetical protein
MSKAPAMEVADVGIGVVARAVVVVIRIGDIEAGACRDEVEHDRPDGREPSRRSG